MNDLYVVAVYDVEHKIMGMKAVQLELIADVVMAFGDMANGELDTPVTNEEIEKEIATKKIYRKSYKHYHVAVKRLDYMVKHAVGK